jgi:hypothetical protein
MSQVVGLVELYTMSGRSMILAAEWVGEWVDDDAQFGPEHRCRVGTVAKVGF